jgi:hypothetical protein
METKCIVFATLTDPNNILLAASFENPNDGVALRWHRYGRNVVDRYREIDGLWTLESTNGQDKSEAKKASLTITLHQDIDVPPTLWAKDTTTEKDKEVWNPNPQLKTLALGTASVFVWTDESGYQWKAGLLKPPDYDPTRRYPLVIQTHGFSNEHEFLVDGAYTTGFAARALAASEIIVLQMPGRPERYTASAAQEIPTMLRGFNSAITQLDQRGWINRDKVGIIGFSRTSWYVENALIQNPTAYRAATIIDGVDNSYMQYMLFGEAAPLLRALPEQANEAKPFGDGLKSWLSHAVGFNLNKVRTPLRIEAITAPSLLSEWETYAALRIQGQPVDLIYIPEGQHVLQSPLDRYVSQQGNVDWFRFWLLGYQDPSPAKAQQYMRWHDLVDEQNHTNSHR